MDVCVYSTVEEEAPDAPICCICCFGHTRYTQGEGEREKGGRERATDM